jgi:hypothetical protein
VASLSDITAVIGGGQKGEEVCRVVEQGLRFNAKFLLNSYS